VAGFKQEIDKTPWIVTSVRHTLDGSGYVSQLTLETEQAQGGKGQEGASVDD
jgi:phage protein D